MAKLDRFTVRGFKSIRALEDFELRDLNVLIGPNGAGKSNFLNVFQMLQQLSTKRLQLFTKGEGGPDALLFGGRRRTSSLSVTLSFDGGRYQYRFSLEPVASVVSHKYAYESAGPFGRRLRCSSSRGNGHCSS